MTIVNLQQAASQKKSQDIFLQLDNGDTAVQTLANALTHPHPTTQLLLTSKIRMHRPEAGLNSLVDAAASVFSSMGRLKHVKSCRDLAELQQELVQEIEQYRETVQVYNQDDQYLAEYIPITCYALCATLDDVIAATPWGGQGKWNEYSLVVAFNQEPLSQKNFFIILERLVRDPAIYIDVMEFMYICLSLGFKCHFNTSAAEFDYEQLEQITNSLYKRIRAYRGNFSKVLSPFPVRTAPPVSSLTWFDRMPGWMLALIGCGALIMFMAVGKWLLHRTYEQSAQQLTQSVAGERV
jgi:type VI secretion system protein ImpK